MKSKLSKGDAYIIIDPADELLFIKEFDNNYLLDTNDRLFKFELDGGLNGP